MKVRFCLQSLLTLRLTRIKEYGEKSGEKFSFINCCNHVKMD